jgi:hypothetical protein
MAPDRAPTRQLLRDRAADGGGLHEAVPGEAARGVEPVADRADDRVSVGSHVIEARPGTDDRGVCRPRITVRKPLAPVLNQVVVDDLLGRPPRGRLGHRQPERLSTPAEVKGRLVLDGHRQISRNVAHGTDIDELPAQWPDGEVWAELS